MGHLVHFEVSAQLAGAQPRRTGTHAARREAGRRGSSSGAGLRRANRRPARTASRRKARLWEGVRTRRLSPGSMWNEGTVAGCGCVDPRVNR